MAIFKEHNVTVKQLLGSLTLTYKKGNKQGYKTAKRCFAIEMRDLAIAMIVVQCGGEPRLFLKHKKMAGISPTIRAKLEAFLFIVLSKSAT